MTGNVECEWNCYAYHLCHGFQIVVDVVAGVAVYATLVGVGITDYREQIVGGILRVFVDALILYS